MLEDRREEAQYLELQKISPVEEIPGNLLDTRMSAEEMMSASEAFLKMVDFLSTGLRDYEFSRPERVRLISAFFSWVK